MSTRILVVDDEPAIQELIRFNLEQQGYEVEVVGDGAAALERFRTGRFDLVVLDLMIPGMDGFEVCRALRRQTWVPIVMLTARSDEVDRVVGLELGADDYVTKPFSPRELLARIKAVLRRSAQAAAPTGAGAPAEEGAEPPDVVRSGDLEIDLGRRLVRVAGREVDLTPTEYQILEALAGSGGRPLSRNALLDRVWGVDFYGDPRTVDVHIRHLREKIELDPANPRHVETVRGFGYRFR